MHAAIRIVIHPRTWAIPIILLFGLAILVNDQSIEENSGAEIAFTRVPMFTRHPGPPLGTARVVQTPILSERRIEPEIARMRGAE